MASIKKLAGQTAIYGFSTILGRLLNYLLVPLHTYLFAPAQYGVVGELYAWVSLFIVILTYGMETAFFRYSQIEQYKNRVYSTISISLLFTSTLFIALCTVFSSDIATWLHYENHPEYITWLSIIIGIDALTSIFFARLRYLMKAVRFAAIKITNILINVTLNLFFLLLCPYLLKQNMAVEFVNMIYHPEIGVGYIFISNLVASVATLLLLLPEILKVKFTFDWKLWKEMFIYAFPLLILGLAGIVNETMDRVLLKNLSPPDIAQSQVGIYSACYKISIMMTIFIQAFKYAAEPFFFNKSKDKDAKETYAEVMTVFVLICSVIFVGIMLYIDIVKYFVGIQYHVGLEVVPILLLANLFLGIFYNLSIWYKLTGQTKFGAYISIFGAIITLVLN
ncbi:MAG: oligosaccharide flippase family protein, partial [Bacteroidales bacterium]